LGIGCQILRDLGVRKLDLLTNQQADMPALDAFGLSINRRLSV
jgi:GTP cyclohydrolase II